VKEPGTTGALGAVMPSDVGSNFTATVVPEQRTNVERNGS
jgi:hypothetical protein